MNRYEAAATRPNSETYAPYASHAKVTKESGEIFAGYVGGYNM